MVPLGYSGGQFEDLLRCKLDNPATAPAYHVIVRPRTIGMLVVCLLYVKADLLEDPAIDQKREGAIDGGLSNVPAVLLELVQDLLSFEVFLELQNCLQGPLPRFCPLDPVIAKVFPKCLIHFVGGVRSI